MKRHTDHMTFNEELDPRTQRLEVKRVAIGLRTDLGNLICLIDNSIVNGTVKEIDWNKILVSLIDVREVLFLEDSSHYT